MKKIWKVFSSDSIYHKTNDFYRLFILSCYFSIAILPWIILNSFLRLSVQTYFFYAVVGIWVFPNLLSLFSLIKTILEEDSSIRFKEYFYVLKHYLSSGFLIGTGGMSILSLLLFELLIILKNENIMFILPIFIITIGLFGASLLHCVYIKASYDLSLNDCIKFAFFNGWKEVLRSFLLSGIFILWLSLGYYSPLINLFGGSFLSLVAVYWLLHKSYMKSSKSFKIQSDKV